MQALTTPQNPHLVWEFYFSIVCIEKYAINSYGLPCSIQSEVHWFEWQSSKEKDGCCEEGSYQPCKQPEWAEGTFGFAG